jgi:hypothetical protein
VTVAELWAQDISPAGTTCAEFEYFCDHCGDEFCDHCGFEAEYTRATIAESMLSARGQSLPERIALWCKANEPERIAADIAGRLCTTFADVKVDDLTQYEANVFRAVAVEGWRK